MGVDSVVKLVVFEQNWISEKKKNINNKNITQKNFDFLSSNLNWLSTNNFLYTKVFY